MGLWVDTGEVVAGVIRVRNLFANLYLLGDEDGWVLVDAGLPRSAGSIVAQAELRLGKDTAPRAVIMTHGHFDHVGAFPAIFDHWDVPVYAHPAELPFLAGVEKYPPPDPTVGKGMMALSSFLYPRSSSAPGERLHPLPDDGSVPHLPGWRWIHTPGHTRGHVSFFRDDDRVLVAGDAFVTTRQESLHDVIRQAQTVQGPPAYFTPDWVAAKASVIELADLRPRVAATGHGTPMSGDALDRGLARLVTRFEEIAIPKRGRYVP